MKGLEKIALWLWLTWGLCGCATIPAPSRIDWAAIDAVFEESRWRVNHCKDPNSARCDAMWMLRDELEAAQGSGVCVTAGTAAALERLRAELELIARRTRAAFERGER